MLKVILIAVLAVYTFKYTLNVIRRIILIHQTRRECKKQNLDFRKKRCLLKSVFLCDGGVDFEIGNASVHIITPLFRRVRYSFTDDRRLEVIIARIQAHMRNGKVGTAGYVSNVFTLRNNKLKRLGNTDDGRKHILLVYPIPFEVTRVKDNVVTAAYNGDEIWKNCIFSNKSYFIENIMTFAK